MPVCAAPPFAADTGRRCEPGWRPHDLLKLRHLQPFNGEPAWVRDAFGRAPFAVVRRAQAAAGFVAIGMRGDNRAQRHGTWAQTGDIESAIAPEELANARPAAGRNALPAFAALAALRRDAQLLQTFVWGPTGSVGFELATLWPAVTLSSDLDLLIRVPEKLIRAAAAALLDQLQAHANREGMRIDAQLETPAGGVALVELAAGKPRVLARHARGPQLVADPWLAGEA